MGNSKTDDAKAAMAFFVNPDPTSEHCRELEDLVPGNPFYTAGFVSTMRSLGAEPWILGLRQDGNIVSACTAFLRRGRINRRLDIVSIPDLANLDIFWKGLMAHCRKVGISIVNVGSFCSTNGLIPKMSGETKRSERWEFVLDLQEGDLEKRLHRTHRANIRKARNAGVEIRRTTDERACEDHLRLILDSRKRRIDRGEMVAATVNSEEHRLYLRNGVGELFLAVQGGEVVSSDLVLKSAHVVYAQSAGTSPRGMNCHASHLLIFEIAQAFLCESKHALNLGGANSPTGGLAQFKSYFRPKVVDLQSAEFYLGNAVLKKLTKAAGLWDSYRHSS
jgi:lipid II:glycine glycyltransferase (peptidoglycan interpeptide bridge formation enzyme)